MRPPFMKGARGISPLAVEAELILDDSLAVRGSGPAPAGKFYSR